MRVRIVALPTYCRACGFVGPAADHPCLVDFEAARAEGATPEQALQAAKNGHERRELTAFYAKARARIVNNKNGLHGDTGEALDIVKLAAKGLTVQAVKDRAALMLTDLENQEKRALGTVKSTAQEMVDEIDGV